METKKLKILYVITKSNWGGAQKYVFDLATALPKELYDVSVVFGGEGPLAKKLQEKEIQTISLPRLGRDINIFSDVMVFFNLISLFLKEKPEIVHVNSSKIGGLGTLAARLTGIKKIIFTCHGWPFNEERKLLSLWMIRILSWVTVIFSHLTIVVSERDLQDGEKLPFTKKKIVLIHNGVRKTEFQEKNEAFLYIKELANQKGVELNNKDLLIGAIGELHKNKGYEYMIQAIANLKKLKIETSLVVMGEGEERGSLESLIKKLEVEKNVALIGFVENASSKLKAFDLFLLTSIKEGLPYVVIEAGFASLPVIATNVGGVKEIIDDMQSGILVQTRKPDDIAKAIEFISLNKNKAEIFAKKLYEKTSIEFSLSKMVEKTLEIYKK